MPQTKVVFYQEKDGTVPVLDWLDDIPAKAQLKCLAKIERLKQEGHELRRPEADLLRDKIYELRSSFQGVHYRILYFFHDRNVAVLSHSITKEDSIPPVEIERAMKRKRQFEQHPEKHTYAED